MSTDINSWTNWDTWEVHNILTNDELIYNEIVIVSFESNIRYFRVMVIEAVKQWYERHPIMDKLKVDFKEVNFVELKRVLSAGN